MGKSTSKSFKKQLLVGIIFSFTFLQLFFGMISYTSMKKFLFENIDSHNEHVIYNIKEKINDDISNPIYLVEELVNVIKSEPTLNYTETILPQLQAIVSLYDFVSSIRLIDSDGNMVVAAPNIENSNIMNYSYESFFTRKPIGNEEIYSSVYISTINNQPTVTVAKNIGENLMVMELNLIMFNAVEQREKDMTILSVSLLDQYGNYLKDTNESNVLQRLRHPLFDTIKNMDDREYFFRKDDNINTIVITSKVGLQKEWYLVIVENYDQIMMPLRHISQNMIFSFFAFFAVSLLLIFWIMKNVMIDFSHLTSITNSISEGLFNDNEPPLEYIEFRNLSEDFFRMRTIIESREQIILQTNNNLANTISHLEEEIEEHKKTLLNLDKKDKELKKLLNEAKDANLAKGYFLANMSHEIRTPINGIFGIINLLRMSELNSEQKLYLNTVHSSAETLITILNDILDFSKIELGKVKLNYNLFDLRVTLEELQNLFYPTAMYKGIELKVSQIGEGNQFLIGDETRIRQVLSNLVGNAIKFTEHGTVKVMCELTKIINGGVLAQFIVSDTGIGITQEEQRHIFNRFVQLDNTVNKHRKGTGLGLSISKALVEQMGGTIRVECPETGGSNFIVDIPFEVGETILDSDEKLSLEEEIFRQNQFVDFKILISDDDPTSLFMMRTFFRKMGADVRVAEDGLQTLERLNSEDYDLILLDANMPKMNGLEAAKEIRKRRILSRQGKEIPIIATTAYTIEDNKNEYITAGMNECISKPVHFGALIELIISMGAKFEFNESNVFNNNKEIISETLNELSKDSGFDEATCVFILRTFVEQAKEILVEMKNLMESDTETHLFKALGRHLHKLKGSAGNVRAKTVMALSIEAEEACAEGNMQKIVKCKDVISEMVEVYAEYLNSIEME